MKHHKQSIKKTVSSTLLYVMLIIIMAFSVSAAQLPVDLRTAEDFVILAKSGVSTTGTTLITGNIGVSPIDSTALTGFGSIMDSSNEYSTSSLVTGKMYAADYTSPTPSIMTTAISDMETAYADAAGRTNPTATELGAGDISGMILTPGLYTWGTGVLINNDVTLSGGTNDVWIFQIAQDLTVGEGAIIILNGGAQAKNIFWQIGGATTLGTTSNFKGVLLSKTAIAMNTGATLKGRALAQTAVTLDASTITVPTSSTTTSTTTSTSTSTSESTSSSNDENNDILIIRTNTSSDSIKDSSLEKNQVDQEINQELNKQITERKAEIKSGEYTNSFGQLLRVRALASNLKELQVNGVMAQTHLNITAETDTHGETRFTAKLRNGQEREIKIMPDTASQKALEMLRVTSCSSDNKCAIQLKDVGSGAEEKIQYEMQLEKQSRILGLFPKKMWVRADVNAQTGEVRVHKPWWAFMATEPAE